MSSESSTPNAGDRAERQRGKAEPLPWFAVFSRVIEHSVGRSSTFAIALAVVVAWAVSGPLFGWSDTWQLVINTGTTIVTFLMVFVIQNTQTRDTAALHLKLDELIRVSAKARNSLLGLEGMSDKEIEHARALFQRLAVVDSPAAPTKPKRSRRSRPKLVSSKEEISVTARVR